MTQSASRGAWHVDPSFYLLLDLLNLHIIAAGSGQIRYFTFGGGVCGTLQCINIRNFFFWVNNIRNFNWVYLCLYNNSLNFPFWWKNKRESTKCMYTNTKQHMERIVSRWILSSIFLCGCQKINLTCWQIVIVMVYIFRKNLL